MDNADFEKALPVASEAKPGRRNVLRFIAGTLGGLALASVYNPKSTNTESAEKEAFLAKQPISPTPTIKSNLSTPTPKPTQQSFQPSISPTMEIPKHSETVEKDAGDILLNNILSQKAGSREREVSEVNYLNFLSKNLSKDRIDKGLWVISNIKLRHDLIALRYQLRPLDQKDLLNKNSDLMKWYQNNSIHPEILGICLDSYPKARKVLQDIQTAFKKEGGNFNFEGTFLYSLDLNENIQNMMINPGGMATLVARETSGFTNIGSGEAVLQINTDTEAFPTAVEDLRKLCQKLEGDTGLEFSKNFNHVPGSQRGDISKNLSGGAIGLQFMPNQALALYEIMQKAGYKFNPFDPTSAVIGAWVFLALEKQGLGFKGSILTTTHSYTVGESSQVEHYRKEALASWNNSATEIDSVLIAANEFFAKFKTVYST